jgi:hypothetical protein
MSAVFTEHAIFWSKISDSHEDIIKEFGLNDKLDEPQIVRVEFVPPNEDYRKPFSEWTLQIDQDKIPEWFSEKYATEILRKEVKKWSKWHVFIDRDGKLEETSSVRVYGKSKVRIKKLTGGEAWSYEISNLEITEMTGGYARSCGTSTMTIAELTGGEAWSYDTSTLTIKSYKRKK